MLTALGKGVKGGKWFSLMDKVYSRKNLSAAWKRVKENRGSSGVDRQTVETFERHADTYLDTLAEDLKADRYQVQPVRRVEIPKGEGKTRPLGIPTVTDRVVQTALRNVLEPIFEKKFAEQSYGFRPERSCKDALRRVQQLLNEGYSWVVDADIEKYFDTIDHGVLTEEVEKEISDGRVLTLIKRYLQQPVMEAMRKWEGGETGTPQGAVISPLLANVYLHPVDEAMQKEGYEMVRYADDLVVLCKTESEAKAALEKLERLLVERKLKLHPEKTRIVDATQSEGFEFLGYHFERGYKWPRKKSIKKLRDTIRLKTRRANGNSLATIVASINPVLRGWFNYFKHSHYTTFDPIDKWVRMRIRSILRKRRGVRGRERGSDHRRWPNAFFQEKGLFTMAEAYRLLCQSS